MLSDRVAAELRKLCDQVAPFPDEEARRLVIAQLGSGLSLGRCVAAASLGQARHPNTRLTQKSRIPAFRGPGLLHREKWSPVCTEGAAAGSESCFGHGCCDPASWWQYGSSQEPDRFKHQTTHLATAPK